MLEYTPKFIKDRKLNILCKRSIVLILSLILDMGIMLRIEKTKEAGICLGILYRRILSMKDLRITFIKECNKNKRKKEKCQKLIGKNNLKLKNTKKRSSIRYRYRFKMILTNCQKFKELAKTSFKSSKKINNKNHNN